MSVQVTAPIMEEEEPLARVGDDGEDGDDDDDDNDGDDESSSGSRIELDFGFDTDDEVSHE